MSVNRCSRFSAISSLPHAALLRCSVHSLVSLSANSVQFVSHLAFSHIPLWGQFKLAVSRRTARISLVPLKPFALRELLARLRALGRRSADRPKSSVLQIADLTLDTVTHRVQRGGRAFELTAKEFAVLACLMREPGRVFTRLMIAEHVWNYDIFNQ